MGVNRHPFAKDKWDERAYFLVQDVLYEGMDDGHVSVNVGISDLAILALTTDGSAAFTHARSPRTFIRLAAKARVSFFLHR
jgi:hypothetical protein